MRKVLTTAVMLLAPLWYSQAAWSLGAFGNFENLLRSVECLRNPSAVCTPKTQDGEEAPEEVAPEPEPVNPDLLSQVQTVEQDQMA